MITSQILGNTGEAKVILELTKLGWNVFTPLNKSSSIDLIVEHNGKTFKIQVKSSHEKDGKIICSLCASTYRYKKFYTENEVDYFAIYNYTRDEIYLIPYTDNHSITIRITEPKNKQIKKIIYSKDVLFENSELHEHLKFPKEKNIIEKRPVIVKSKKIYNKTCIICNSSFETMTEKQIFCSIQCANKRKKENAKRKITITVEEMRRLVWEKPIIKIAEELYVSNNGIIKFCKRNNIERPKPGYWNNKKY